MIKILSIIFLVLLIIVGKKQGLKTYICFYLNYILILSYILFMAFGFNAIIVSIITCLIASLITLFLINGNNIKTRSSFVSICFVLIIMFVIVFLIGKNANIQGFSLESIETIGLYSYDINYNMTDVIIGMILVCTIGTIIDTSISISTSLNEVYINNTNISEKELYNSGMNIGKDILSTTINTLFFAFLGGIIAFFFWHYSESFEYIINYKVLVQEIVELLCCCIGSILVIPITSYITSLNLIKTGSKVD